MGEPDYTELWEKWRKEFVQFLGLDPSGLRRGLPFYCLEGPEHRVEAVADPVGSPAWLAHVQRLADPQYRIVAVTVLAPGVEVSTVFLGYDTRPLPSGEPLVFETIVFAMEGIRAGPWRYTSWAEAEAGHARVVAAMQARTEP